VIPPRKQEGIIATPFDRTVLNDLSRYSNSPAMLAAHPLCRVHDRAAVVVQDAMCLHFVHRTPTVPSSNVIRLD